jgi:hypothetical protein
LAFHRLPQVIPAFCNRPGFGPPRMYSTRFTLLMVRSPGFGSTERHSSPFRTRFRSGSTCLWLNLATPTNSLAHSTKGTPSPPKGRLRPAGSTRFQVLFHSPSRGTFHRSLTVLVHYRSPWVFSLGSWATLLPTGFRVSGGTHAHDAPPIAPFTYRTLTLSGPLFQYGSAGSNGSGERSADLSRHRVQPQHSSGGSLGRCVGLGSSRFARRYYGNPLFSSGYVRCFSSPGSLRRLRARSAVSSGGCPIRIPWDHRLPAPPPCVSSRGHVLHRPLAPRHPPCALLRLCLPTSSVSSHVSSSWCAR